MKIQNTINYPRGLFISSPFKGGGGCLIETGHLFEMGGLLKLEKIRDLEHKVEKLKYKKVGGQAAKDKKQISTSSW